MHLSGRSNFARKLKVRYTVSEKFQTVSFDLYSSVMGITGSARYGGPQQNLRRVRVAGEVFLATGLAVFLVLTGIQLLRLVFAVRLSLQNGIHVPVRTFVLPQFQVFCSQWDCYLTVSCWRRCSG